MNEYKLKKLVIKPTLACTGNCKTCAYRRELHKELLKEKWLSFDQWMEILEEWKGYATYNLKNTIESINIALSFILILLAISRTNLYLKIKERIKDESGDDKGQNLTTQTLKDLGYY